MSPEKLQQHILDAIAQTIPGADINALSPEESLRDAFEIDSMDQLNLVTELYNRIGIEVPESDYWCLLSVKTIGDYFLKKEATTLAR